MYIYDTITETFVEFYYRDLNRPSEHSYSGMETMEHNVMGFEDRYATLPLPDLLTYLYSFYLFSSSCPPLCINAHELFLHQEDICKDKSKVIGQRL